jgi:cell division topological specificity factor
MGLFDLFFWRKRQDTAALAKDRLSIIVARERRGAGGLDYLPQLKQELLAVLAKYERIDLDQVNVSVEREGDCDVLELNVVLSDSPAPRAFASAFG